MADNTPVATDIAKLLLDCSSAKLTYADAQEQLHKLNLPVDYISRNKVFRSVAVRNAKAIGDFTAGFQVLQSYLRNLMVENPGSVYSYQTVTDTDGNARFGRLALILKSEINMLLNSKPILSFDGGHMKHVMWGSYHVLVCGTQDGENRDCSVGIAIVPSESEESYKFFIQTMKKAPELQKYFEGTKLVITSDKAKGLQNAIRSELPNSFHRFCALHLLGNIKSGRAFNESDRKLYWDIVFSDSESKFNENMKILQNTHKEAYEYLITLNPAEWTNWAFSALMWGHVTNNLSERAVKFIGTDNDHGRKQPIVELLDELISKVSNYDLTVEGQ